MAGKKGGQKVHCFPKDLERPAYFCHNGMSKQKIVSETPLMQQHKAIKAKYPDAVLLFRVGDFYETFGQDANS